MSEWISKAANVFKRDVSETPQPFEVHCECGQKHGGIRRSRQQHLVCKTCGSSLFVLPHDTYPPPHVPKSSGKKRKRKPSASKPVEDTLDLAPTPVIGLEDEEESEAESGRRSRRLNEVDPEQQSSTSEVDDRPNIFVRLIHSFFSMVRGFVEVFWEFWTPYRKLALLIACVLALTAYYSIHQSRLRSAVNVVKEELESGLADLNQTRWVEARQHFEIASNAVDLLDRDDLEANSIRQYHRETTALTRLTSISLIELAEIAENFYIENGAEGWQQEFERKYQTDWYIIEGYLRPTTDADAVSKGDLLELVFPIAVGNRQRPVDVQMAFPLAKNLPQVTSETVYDSGAGNLAIFAVQVEQCALGTNGNWVLRMNPATSFFWVNLATYEATHLHTGSITPVEEQTQLFQQQGLWMGVRQ
jgi:hypothetical protein